MIRLSDILDTKKFAKHIANGEISERAHDEDNALRVYSYTPKVQYAGLWTAETKTARGLMLRLSDSDIANGTYDEAIVVGRGLSKFFTVEQMGEDWSQVKLVDDDEGVTITDAPDISWDTPAFVADKMNGALGLSYVSNGLAGISTKGSFGSTEAGIATEVLGRRGIRESFGEFLTNEFADRTVLFEIITPQRLHPVNYGDLEDLYYLGYIENRTGEWTPATVGDAVDARFGFLIAARQPLATLREAVDAPYQANTEGFVVVVGSGVSQELYKVKPREYGDLRNLFYSAEPARIRRMFTNMEPAAIFAAQSEDEIDLSGMTAIKENALNTQIFAAARSRLWVLIEDAQVVYRESVAIIDELGLADIQEGREVLAILAEHDYPSQVVMGLKKSEAAGQSAAKTTTLKRLRNKKITIS